MAFIIRYLSIVSVSRHLIDPCKLELTGHNNKYWFEEACWACIGASMTLWNWCWYALDHGKRVRATYPTPWGQQCESWRYVGLLVMIIVRTVMLCYVMWCDPDPTTGLNSFHSSSLLQYTLGRLQVKRGFIVQPQFTWFLISSTKALLSEEKRFTINRCGLALLVQV